MASASLLEARRPPEFNLRSYLQEAGSMRRRALDAAAHLFRVRGFADVSMIEVAQEIGLSKPGLYHHWASKDALLQTIVRLSGELLLAHLEAVLDSESDPVARLRSYIVTRLETVADYQDFFNVMWQERATVGAESFTELSARAELYRARVRDLIDAAKAVDGLKHGIDTHLLMLALDGMTGWACSWYHPAKGKTPMEIGQAFWLMLSGGILAEPPTQA